MSASSSVFQTRFGSQQGAEELLPWVKELSSQEAKILQMMKHTPQGRQQLKVWSPNRVPEMFQFYRLVLLRET